MSAVTINKILENGAKYNPTGEICSFLQDVQLSRVSKAFRLANTATVEQVGRRIALEDRASVQATSQEARLLCSEEERGSTAAGLFAELFTAIRASVLAPVKRAELEAGLYKLEQVYHKNLEAQDASSEHAVDRIILFLNRMKQALTDFPAPLADQLEHAETPEQTAAYEQLFNQGKKFLTRENLALRFKEVGRVIPALYASQKDGAAFSATQASRFEELERSSFSLERFQAAEEVVLDAEIDRDRALGRAWQGIRGRILAGPQLGAPASEIRAWMNDPANQAQLQRVYWLELDQVNACPPEIGRLHNLYYLGLSNGMMTSLPRELENLTSLTALQLNNQRFNRVPELIRRMPWLSVVNLARNPEFRSVDEASARHFFGWGSLFFEAVGDLLSVLTLDEHYATWRDLRLFCARDQVAEMPFSLWFRDAFSIPHFPLMGVLPIGLILSTIISLAVSLLSFLPSILFVALEIILNLPVVALCLALILLDLPIFFWNAFIGMAAEPFVTQVRDYFEYSPMVRLQEDTTGVTA